MQEVVLGEILVSPFIGYVFLALIVFIPLRMVLLRLGLQHYVWHPRLAEASLYICILALLHLTF
ncbi:DUF1656 domain-containing protein [Beijerinckia indica]|uniref:DUF1656 domain-containing protein n=1 Tax=Beijerinckia indica subsp. indica (strain ATCC 9039 / DSM 1715 / NCIMB 8712) TaxID=395963 RepID=B2IKB0_BEII9|nr:DUF1656 domain-containing protein [Beijerinckia indica]ACB95040.1 protein of unknown function DUF1656 [Beijerinckia indica subsp. indica ATCC 9039]